MKEAIGRMKEIAYLAKKHEWDEDVTVKIQLSHVFAVLAFYESHKKESESTPTVPGITPEWNTLDEKFKWTAIDPDGVEIAFIRKPQKLQKYMHGCNAWVGRNCQSTGRFIDMKGIDWTKTLSKRPVKE